MTDGCVEETLLLEILKRILQKLYFKNIDIF